MSEVVEKMTGHVGQHLDAYMNEYKQLVAEATDLEKQVKEILSKQAPIKERLIALSAAIQCFQSMKNIVEPVIPAAEAAEAAVEVVEAVAQAV